MSEDKQKDIFSKNLNSYIENSGKTQLEIAKSIVYLHKLSTHGVKVLLSQEWERYRHLLIISILINQI